MKLTEKQLAELFTNSTKTDQTSFDAGSCLNAMPASATRLNQAETVLNDFHSAQGMKMAFSFKDWSSIVAQSIQSSQKSWFSFLGMNTPFKTSLATVAFAFAFVVALPQFSSTETVVNPIDNHITSDLIQRTQFEESHKADQLSRGGFDDNTESKDSLFNANFG